MRLEVGISAHEDKIYLGMWLAMCLFLFRVFGDYTIYGLKKEKMHKNNTAGAVVSLLFL